MGTALHEQLDLCVSPEIERLNGSTCLHLVRIEFGKGLFVHMYVTRLVLFHLLHQSNARIYVPHVMKFVITSPTEGI